MATPFWSKSTRMYTGLALSLICAATACAQEFENPGMLQASLLAGSVPLEGDGYVVREHATLVGNYGRYVVESDQGVFIADGADMLQLRIKELGAVRELEQMSRGRVMVDSGGRRLSKPVEQVKRIAEQPRETVSGLPAGVRRYVVRGAERVGEVALDVADAARDKWNEDRSAEQVAPESEQASKRSARLLKGLALRQIGYHNVRRGLARHLGVDPYSSNPILAEHLDQLAWAAWVGDKGVSLGLGAVISGPVDTALGIADDAHELVWRLTPQKVSRRNKKLLASMSLRGKPARDFLRNGAFNPLLQTAFVDLLSYPGYSAVRPQLMALGTTADSEREARSLIETLHALRTLAQSAQGLPRVGMFGQTPVLDSGDGSLTIVLPADYLAWTEETSQLAMRSDLIANRPRLLVRGLVSDRAVREFARAGWRVEQRWSVESIIPPPT